jgi:hypothetical protein
MRKIASQFLGGKPGFFQLFLYPSYSKILQGFNSFPYTLRGGKNHGNIHFPKKCPLDMFLIWANQAKLDKSLNGCCV